MPEWAACSQCLRADSFDTTWTSTQFVQRVYSMCYIEQLELMLGCSQPEITTAQVVMHLSRIYASDFSGICRCCMK
jgi:hypothetical protein